MKYFSHFVSGLVLVAAVTFIAAGCSKEATPSTPSATTNSVASTDSFVLPAGTIPYPLTNCVVSGEKFGGNMGKPIEFIYVTNGISQEIKFCCPMCKPQFLADPEKYMKTIKDAEAAKK